MSRALKEKKEIKNTIECTCCGKEQKLEEFYNSYSYIYNFRKKLPVCKKCIVNIYDRLNAHYKDERISVLNFCRLFDVYFSDAVLEGVFQQVEGTNSSLIRIYMQKANSLVQCKDLTFAESNYIDSMSNAKLEKQSNQERKQSVQHEAEVIEVQDLYESYLKNKNDIIRLLGDDPFLYEEEEDKPKLYSTLIDFLDESTLEDGFKLPAVIEIVKGYNQIEKINRALAALTSDVDKLSSNSGSITSLVNSKEKILKSLLALAKDNGISANHNNNKSKGAGTLSGIIKQLQEKNFDEVEVNLFDIETAGGIRQVADISNESIIKQLQFDENDYTEMILDQRELIQELDDKFTLLEEENRKLKKEIIKYKNQLSGDINE